MCPSATTLAHPQPPFARTFAKNKINSGPVCRYYLSDDTGGLVAYFASCDAHDLIFRPFADVGLTNHEHRWPRCLMDPSLSAITSRRVKGDNLDVQHKIYLHNNYHSPGVMRCHHRGLSALSSGTRESGGSALRLNPKDLFGNVNFLFSLTPYRPAAINYLRDICPEFEPRCINAICGQCQETHVASSISPCCYRPQHDVLLTSGCRFVFHSLLEYLS